MSTNTEDIRYEFQGDTSSLKRATQEAIGLLGSYEKAVDKADSASSFSNGLRGIQAYGSSIQRSLNAVSQLQAKLQQISSATAGTKLAAGMFNTQDFQVIAQQLMAIQSASESTTGSIYRLASSTDMLGAAYTNMAPAIQNASTLQAQWQTILQSALATVNTGQADFVALGSIIIATNTQATSAMTSMISKFMMVPAAIDPIETRMRSLQSTALTTTDRMRTTSLSVADAFRRESDYADSTADAINALGAKKKKTTKDENSLGSASTDTSNAFRREGKAASSLSSILSGLGSKVFTVIKVISGSKIGELFSEGIKQSINYIENLNLFTVAMGDSIDVANDFVAKMSDMYGLDPSNLVRYAGNFFQLATAVDMTDSAAQAMSLNLTKMTTDISSLFNVDVESVFEDLQSGIQGMSRAVRKYGMDIRTVQLQQTAASLGLTESVSSMSEANRQALRYITMMRQAANATGDFANTIETPANQLKIFKEQMTQLGRAIGDFFIKPIGIAIQYINGFIMALRSILTFISSLFGLVDKSVQSIDYKNADKTSAAISGIGDSAGSTAKKLKDLIAPFDELNVLQEQSDAGSGGGGGGGGLGADVLDPKLAETIENMGFKLDEVRMKANQVRDSILNFLGFQVDAGQIIKWDPKQFEANLIDKLPGWDKTIHQVFESWPTLVRGASSSMQTMGTAMSTVGSNLLQFVSTLGPTDEQLASFIEGFTTHFQNFATIAQGNGETIGSMITTLISPMATLVNESSAFESALEGFAQTAWSSLGQILDAAASTFEAIFSGVLDLWANDVQPTFESLGDMLAPVLDTLSSLWSNVTGIIVTTLNTIASVWTNSIMPVLQIAFGWIRDLAKLLQDAWTIYIGPIVKSIGDLLEDTYTNHLAPVFEKIGSFIKAIAELVDVLWQKYLKPFMQWNVNTFGPILAEAWEGIKQAISAVINTIVDIIGNIIDVLTGVIDFVTGVFTGDWKKALTGLLEIVLGIVNGIISLVEGAVNLVIGLLNALWKALFAAVKKVWNALASVVEGIADAVGVNLNIKITGSVPSIPTLSIPRVPMPALAGGGVVTKPTMLIAGEGRYDEAILPLGDSPQMADLVQKIADKLEDTPKDSEPVTVKVYIGNEEFDAYTYKAVERGKAKVGVQPIKEKK